MTRTPIVPLGDSRGIQIPEEMLDAMGSPNAVLLELRDGMLIVHPVPNPRAGWDDPSMWKHAKLTREDREWLAADLSD
jgi:hypothetical protein